MRKLKEAGILIPGGFYRIKRHVAVLNHEELKVEVKEIKDRFLVISVDVGSRLAIRSSEIPAELPPTKDYPFYYIYSYVENNVEKLQHGALEKASFVKMLKDLRDWPRDALATLYGSIHGMPLPDYLLESKDIAKLQMRVVNTLRKKLRKEDKKASSSKINWEEFSWRNVPTYQVYYTNTTWQVATSNSASTWEETDV